MTVAGATFVKVWVIDFIAEGGNVRTRGSYLSQHQVSRVVIFLHADKIVRSTDDDLVCQLRCNGPVIATPWSWHDAFGMNLRLSALSGILDAFAEVEISPGSARKLAQVELEYVFSARRT